MSTMNENEIMYEENEIVTVNEPAEVCEDSEKTGLSTLGKVAIGAVVAGVGALIYKYKTSPKRKQKNIENAKALLESEGYTMTEPVKVEAEAVDVECEDVSEVEDSE